MKTKEQIVAEIEARWTERARTQGLNPRSTAYKKAEVEFFCGAMAGMHAMDQEAAADKMSAFVPPKWVVCIMSGRPVIGGL